MNQVNVSTVFIHDILFWYHLMPSKRYAYFQIFIHNDEI